MASVILSSFADDLQIERFETEMERLLKKYGLEMVMRGQKSMNWIRDAFIIILEITDFFTYYINDPLYLEERADEDCILKLYFHLFIIILLSVGRTCKLRTKMKHIREKVVRLYETRPSPSDVELVGFDGYIQRLDGWLREEGDLPHSGLKIGVIYGPPGSGKTNLAFEVYNSDAVKTQFSSLVWVPTPSSSSLDDSSYYKLLLRHFVETALEQLEVNRVGMASEGFVEAVCAALKDKRYLIVVDGNVDLNSVTNFFEMVRNMGILNVGQNGSRMVITSQKKIDPNGPIIS